MTDDQPLKARTGAVESIDHVGADATADWVQRWAVRLGVVAVLGCLLAFRWALVPYTAFDAQHFVIGWFNYLDRHGWRALGTRFADYNVPYLYLLYAASLVTDNALVAIKAISNLGDLALAWGIYRVISPQRGRRIAAATALSSLLLPSVWLNSAVWGQTDQLYTALVIHAVADLLRGRQHRAWGWAGVAVSFKLQAIFVVPFLLLVWLRDRRRSWLAPPLAVIAWAAMAMPALVIGLPWRDLVKTYAQMTAPGSATRASNLWQLFHQSDLDFLASFTVFAAAVVGVFMVACLLWDEWFADPRRWLVAAATITIALPYTLPGMRDRYYFLGEILVLLAAVALPRLWWVAVVALVASAYGYSRALFNVSYPISNSVSALPYLLVLVALVREVFRSHRPSTLAQVGAD